MSKYQEIVRLFGVSLKGSKVLVEELTRINGIGPTLARSIIHRLGIPINKRVGELSEEEVKALEEYISNISRNFPDYVLNRRFDRFTGESHHLIGSDVKFIMERDIEFEKSIDSWRGIRHKLGLKVRGQRTRTTGRKSKVPVGVRRKKK